MKLIFTALILLMPLASFAGNYYEISSLDCDSPIGFKVNSLEKTQPHEANVKTHYGLIEQIQILQYWWVKGDIEDATKDNQLLISPDGNKNNHFVAAGFPEGYEIRLVLNGLDQEGVHTVTGTLRYLAGFYFPTPIPLGSITCQVGLELSK
jgi:hypothetical protein